MKKGGAKCPPHVHDRQRSQCKSCGGASMEQAQGLPAERGLVLPRGADRKKREGGREGERRKREGEREDSKRMQVIKLRYIYMSIHVHIFQDHVGVSYQPTVGSRVFVMIVDKIWKLRRVRSPAAVRRETQQKPRTCSIARRRVYPRGMQESFKRAPSLPLSTGSLP